MSVPASPYALVIGEALIDVVDHRGTLERVPGGSPANVALGLGRLGREVDLLTWLGDDLDGATIRGHLSASGVHVVNGTTAAARTSVASARVDASGAATYHFDVEWDLPEAWATRAGTPVVVHAGSLGVLLDPGAERVLAELRGRRAASVVTYDPNLRPALMGEPTAARSRVEALVGLADVVKVSDEDLAWLWPGRSVAAIAREWLGRGPGLVVVTQGRDGAFAWTRGGSYVAVPAETVHVVDTVGAGDSFMAALIDGLWSSGLLDVAGRAALGDVDVDLLRSVVERCVRVAALTVSRRGANPPRLEQVGRHAGLRAR